MTDNSTILNNENTHIYIISGVQGEGKTTFLLEILKKLANKDIRIKGIAAPGYFTDSIRSGFSVLDLSTGISEELCSTSPSPGLEQHGCYYFRPEGLFFGRKVLQNTLLPGMTDLLVIDEVGKFEVNGEVWADCIDNIVANPYPPMIWTVRCSLVDTVIKKWQLKRHVILKVGSVNEELFMSAILKDIKKYRDILQELS
jgi:nucleoside-triphosphatase